MLKNRGINKSMGIREICKGENGYDRIYDAREELSEPNRLKAKTFKAVISRLGAGLDYGSTILQHLTENLAIYCPQTADGLLTAGQE